MISNILVHREFTSPFVSKFVIEENKMYTENACRATKQARLTPETFIPISKNPIIASIFTNIGNADELGSGTRNLYKYSKLYSGNEPEIYEDDIFKIFVPTNIQYSSDSMSVKEKIYLSNNQEKILMEVKNDSNITAKILSEKIGISERKIQENMKFLKEKNLLKRIGGNKSGKRIVIDV